MAKNKIINIALLGFGTVGRGVWDLFELNSNEFENSLHRKFMIKKILVPNTNKDRGRVLPENIFTENYNEILNDEDIEVIIELTGTDEQAFNYMRLALESEKHVITANKHVIAYRGAYLYNLAKKMGKAIGIEACVCGAIPVIKTVLESLSANRFIEISGIMNGTCNFILDKMEKEAWDYSKALKEAQACGFAEANPDSDVKGLDARNKISILSSLAFKKNFDVNKISVKGIDDISPEHFDFAKSNDCTIKLIARCLSGSKGIFIEVKPMLVHKNHVFYSISGAGNAVLIKTNCAGETVLIGQGAGSLPTASAVVGDLINIALNFNAKNFISDRIISDGIILNDNPYKRDFLDLEKNKFYLEKL